MLISTLFKKTVEGDVGKKNKTVEDSSFISLLPLSMHFSYHNVLLCVRMVLDSFGCGAIAPTSQ